MESKRPCRYVFCLGILLGASGDRAAVHLSGTADMSVYEAVSLVGGRLTPDQADAVAAALRRHGLMIAKSLEQLAGNSRYARDAIHTLNERFHDAASVRR